MGRIIPYIMEKKTCLKPPTIYIYIIYMIWHSINDEGFTKWQIIGNINPVSMELSMEISSRIANWKLCPWQKTMIWRCFFNGACP
jgi:hypothetical protein